MYSCVLLHIQILAPHSGNDEIDRSQSVQPAEVSVFDVFAVFDHHLRRRNAEQLNFLFGARQGVVANESHVDDANPENRNDRLMSSDVLLIEARTEVPHNATDSTSVRGVSFGI